MAAVIDVPVTVETDTEGFRCDREHLVQCAALALASVHGRRWSELTEGDMQRYRRAVIVAEAALNADPNVFQRLMEQR